MHEKFITKALQLYWRKDYKDMQFLFTLHDKELAERMKPIFNAAKTGEDEFISLSGIKINSDMVLLRETTHRLINFEAKGVNCKDNEERTTYLVFDGKDAVKYMQMIYERINNNLPML